MTSVPQTEPSRPDESPPALSGALVTAMVLAAVAGFLDAHLFLNVTEVFVANQSGNVVLLGMYLGEGNWISAAGSAVALGAFAVGVMVATALHVKRRARGLQLRPDIMLGVESVLLVALALVLAFWHPDREPTPTPGHLPLLALGGLAMGLQTTVLGKVGSTAVATTYESGSVVRVSEQAVLGSWTDDVEARRRHLSVLGVLLAVIASYAGGAALSAGIGAEPLLLLLPAAALVVITAVTTRQVHRRRHPGDGRGQVGPGPRDDDPAEHDTLRRPESS